MVLSPCCPGIRDSGVPVVGLSPPSPHFVCAGWQKSSGLLAGPGPNLPLHSFAMESVRAGPGGLGAVLRGQRSLPSWPFLSGSSLPRTVAWGQFQAHRGGGCEWGPAGCSGPGPTASSPRLPGPFTLQQLRIFPQPRAFQSPGKWDRGRK